MSIMLRNPCPWGWQSRGWIAGVHRGIDYGWFNADPAGSRRVVAAAPGRVIEVYNGGEYNQGWGSRVMIEHTDRAKTAYNHHPRNGIQLTVGQLVDYGTPVGPMGSTGATGTPPAIHSHFELYIDNVRVDPAPYFTKPLPGNPVRPAAPAPTPVLGVRDRLTGVQGANGRTQPAATGSAVLAFRNTVVTMDSFTDAGQNVQGNARWFRSTSGLWYWSGGFTSTAKAGLTDLTPPAAPTPLQVTFDDGEGRQLAVVSVLPGATIPALSYPMNLERPGFDFAGWAAAGSPWRPTDIVTADVALAAQWTPAPVEQPEPEPTTPIEPPEQEYTMPTVPVPATPDVILPANVRAGLYLGNWVAGVALAATAAAIVAIDAPVHPALVAAIAGYGVVSSAISGLARANTVTVKK